MIHLEFLVKKSIMKILILFIKENPLTLWSLAGTRSKENHYQEFEIQSEEKMIMIKLESLFLD